LGYPITSVTNGIVTVKDGRSSPAILIFVVPGEIAPDV
jgi:hypothetical protein